MALWPEGYNAAGLHYLRNSELQGRDYTVSKASETKAIVSSVAICVNFAMARL